MVRNSYTIWFAVSVILVCLNNYDEQQKYFSRCLYMSKTSLMNAQTDSAPAISTHCSPAEICISNIVMSRQVYLHFHLIGEQKFGLHDDSSKKMASLSVKRSRMQFANIPSSSPYQWKPSLPDSEPSNASTTFGMFSVSLMPTQLILVFWVDSLPYLIHRVCISLVCCVLL